MDWHIDGNLTGTTTPDQSGSRSNGNEVVFYIPKSFRTGSPPSDVLASYKGHSLRWGVLPLFRDAVGVFYSFPFPAKETTEWRVRLIVLLPVDKRSFWSFPIVNDFCISFQQMVLAVHSFTLRIGCPFSDRSLIRSSSFHFRMMAFVILMIILSLLEICQYPIHRPWW